MEVADKIVNQPSVNSIFTRNINPLRLGFVLYETIDRIEKSTDYSPYHCRVLKMKIGEQLMMIMETFKNPSDLFPIMELRDHDGRDIFYYLQQFRMFGLLDTKIMDRIITDKWEGKHVTGGSMLEYSTSWQLMGDRLKLYEEEDMFEWLGKKTFVMQKGELNHGYKYRSWKFSMSMRNLIQLLFAVSYTILF